MMARCSFIPLLSTIQLSEFIIVYINFYDVLPLAAIVYYLLSTFVIYVYTVTRVYVI